MKAPRPTRPTDVFDVSGGLHSRGDAGAGLRCRNPYCRRPRQRRCRPGYRKAPNATVSARELRIALGELTNLGDRKTVDAATAREVVSDRKRDGLVVGFPNSCFDLIHPGYVDLLRNASAACDRLVLVENWTPRLIPTAESATRVGYSRSARVHIELHKPTPVRISKWVTECAAMDSARALREKCSCA